MQSIVFAIASALVQGSASCSEAGKRRYISFETFGSRHFCAESCLLDSEFEALLPFEAGLSLVDQEAPCLARGYDTLVSSELHAKGPFFRSVDLYAPGAALEERCCGSCPQGLEKHWAIADATCVERCVSADEAARLAVFESPRFRRSEVDSPCLDAGFERLSTEIDAVGPYFAVSDKFAARAQSVLV